MTTARYVRNTRKGRRVERSIKTNIIGRKRIPRFIPLAQRISDREYISLFKLRAELALG